MPIYEYQCEKCEHQFDTLQKINDKPLKKCPECGKMALVKLVSAAGFRLKGSGWYETDFKSGNKKNLANNDGGSAKDSGSSNSSEAASSKSSGSESASSKSGKGSDTATKSSNKTADSSSSGAKKSNSSKSSN